MNVFAFAVHCVIPTGGLSTDLWAVVLLDSERITRDSDDALPGRRRAPCVRILRLADNPLGAVAKHCADLRGLD